MHTSEIDIAYFKKRIEQRMEHTYLHKFIEKPTIDEEKLFILISIMDRAILTAKQKEQYIITTMLVQLALDTHDSVPIDTTHDLQDNSQISKQLTVLAGDYYSGLYYFLLSEIDDFAMIQTLAGAIKEINEFKMNLYYREIESADEFMYTIKKIETLLFDHVSNHIGAASLDQSIEKWLVINKLTLEQKKMQKNKTSPLIDVWRSYCEHHEVTCFQISLEDMIDTQMDHLKASFTSRTFNQYPSTIQELLNDYRTLNLEEG